MSRSSGVFVHRQCESLWKLAAVKPPVRTSAHAPLASRMVATIVARRGPSERRLVATAYTTKAMLKAGIAKMGNNIPCAPVAIDLSMRRDVANSAATIRPKAPKRSDQGGRLKNIHHRTIAKAHTGPASRTPTTRRSPA